MATEAQPPEPGTPAVYHTLLAHSSENRALLLILLNAVGELMAHLHEQEPLEVKQALHERVAKARKQVHNIAFGYPPNYEPAL